MAKAESGSFPLTTVSALRAQATAAQSVPERDAALLATAQVLREEAKAIHGDEAKVEGKSGGDLYRELHRLNSAALCLSGGGIRSAAFALGVIQALASWTRQPGRPKTADDLFLAEFHYLSTVSGGGYIGSWLSAAVPRVGFAEVWSGLTGRPLGTDIEPPFIGWLRSHSNYLTPKLGLASGDTWAAVAMILRNLALNWFIILPALCVALLIAKCYAFLVSWISQFSPLDCGLPTFYPAFLGAVGIVVAVFFMHTQRPAHNDSIAGQRGVVLGYVLPSLLAGVLFTLALASQCAYATYHTIPVFALNAQSKIALGLQYGVAIYLLGWLLAFPFWGMWQPVWLAVIEGRWRAIAAVWPGLAALRDARRDFFAAAVAGAVYGAVIALGLQVYQTFWWDAEIAKFGFVPLRQFKEAGELFLVVLTVPWALSAQILADMIFVGLASHEQNSDSDREWLGRAAGLLMATSLAWAVVMCLVFLAAAIAISLSQSIWASLSGLGIGGVAAWLAKSSLTPAKGPAEGGKALSATVLAGIGAVVFAAVLIVGSSAELDRLIFGDDLIESAGFHRNIVEQGQYPAWPQGWSIVIALAVATAIAWIASYFVNINRFSLHALYRNRLIRAFLGASHATKRSPNPFTDFDVKDNPRMSQIWPPQEFRGELRSGWQPFHIINIALNIVSGRRLAWQERKAESFTVSPLHAGTACGRALREKDGTWRAPGAYRRSEVYGDPYGISLGTALAISGAAANPNMGYHSSPAMSFLMTLFNVRLGWWLGNPARSKYDSDGPTLSIGPLVNELIGNTTDRSNFVNLSDGGHFENLGLYEMVRRRCRTIVVSDGGCDPNFAFEELGNAVRKISLDLGVTITFHGLTAFKSRAQEDRVDDFKGRRCV